MPRNSSLSRLDSAILGASSSSSTQERLKSSESQRNSSLSRLDSAILGASSSSSTQELLKSSESQNYMYFDSTSSSMRGAINEAYEIQRKKELEEGFSTTSSSVENFLGSAVEKNSGRSQDDIEYDLGIKEIN